MATRPEHANRPAAPSSRRKLGAGRSGEVWLVESSEGSAAVKVFRGDTLSNLVHYLFTGAPNPYIWNEDAILAAYERRKVLTALSRVWFGERLHVADALGTEWNEDSRAWELAAEFVDGEPVPLLHPLRRDDETLDALRHDVLEPLQRHLLEAGFDGIVWQAGKGNPVALNNYLYLPEQSGEARGEKRFAFIDLESGVPALFPLSPVELVRYYLPMSFKHRPAMFDDADADRLRSYLGEHALPLRRALGEGALDRLLERVDRIERHQRRWKSMSRTERGIAYQESKDRLSADEAEYYRARHWRWRVREAGRALKKAGGLLGIRLPRKLWGWLKKIDVAAIFRNLGRFVTSQQYRSAIGRRYVRGRVRDWRKRGQLSENDARTLLTELRGDEASAYLSDFGAHLGMKATFQALEFTVFAGLVAAGLLSPLVLPVLIALDGLIYRTLYTLYRMGYAAAHRLPLPWIALLVGLVPLLGSLAFPVQMVFSARERREYVARFLIYDTLGRLGQRIPVWGGKDTLTEHVLNRLAGRLAR
jgi:hypothetical protein